MCRKLVLLLLAAVVSVTIAASRSLANWPDNYLHFVTCDVGQGDALLLTYGFTQILVDAGKGDEVLACLDRHQPFWDKTIELVVITHPDLDHYGGIREVLKRYNVNSLAQLPIRKNDAEFEALQRLIQTKKADGLHLIHPFANEYILFGSDVTITSVWPGLRSVRSIPKNALLTETVLSDKTHSSEASEVDGNPLSISLLIEYRETSILLTGDLEEASELALLKSPLMAKVDVLKVGHHGSKTSSSEPFLQALQPEIAVISVGKNNQYKHPDADVVNRLEKYVGNKLYRTDSQGTIHLFSDGYRIWKQ